MSCNAPRLRASPLLRAAPSASWLGHLVSKPDQPKCYIVTAVVMQTVDQVSGSVSGREGQCLRECAFALVHIGRRRAARASGRHERDAGTGKSEEQ